MLMARTELQHIRLTAKLTEQLRFMQRSCEAFDRGAEDEAIRIATSLRIIFHKTKSSFSLVAHLGLGDTKMLSTSRGYENWQDYLAHQIDLSSPEPIRMLPLLGHNFKELSIEDWWSNEPVFVQDTQGYSRRLIVLSAANKDGGAHVDAELDRYYEVLCAGEYAIGITGNLEYRGNAPFPQGVTQYPKNAHLALIRQFAHETLLSVDRFAWLKDESQDEAIACQQAK
jgi:hypothetical protein